MMNSTWYGAASVGHDGEPHEAWEGERLEGNLFTPMREGHVEKTVQVRECVQEELKAGEVHRTCHSKPFSPAVAIARFCNTIAKAEGARCCHCYSMGLAPGVHAAVLSREIATSDHHNGLLAACQSFTHTLLSHGSQ